MRDFNRKLDKFLKAKIVTDKKNRALSPHVTYSVLAASPSVTTAATKKNTSKSNYSMIVSFYNPRFESPYPKDTHIKHETKKQKHIIVASPERMKSPKRDPILQNNNEPVKEFKPCTRQSEQSGKVTLFTAEPYVTVKGQGECNYVLNPRSFSPKPDGKKKFLNVSKEDVEEGSPRRLRKEVKTAPRNYYNPILEGDGKRVRARKEKAHIRLDTSEHAQKINDRKTILASDLGASPKGKVFWDTKITLDHSFQSFIEPESPVKKIAQRFASPQGKREGIKGILEYSHALPYRDQAITPKCNKISFSEFSSPVKVRDDAN